MEAQPYIVVASSILPDCSIYDHSLEINLLPHLTLRMTWATHNLAKESIRINVSRQGERATS